MPAGRQKGVAAVFRPWLSESTGYPQFCVTQSSIKTSSSNLPPCSSSLYSFSFADSRQEVHLLYHSQNYTPIGFWEVKMWFTFSSCLACMQRFINHVFLVGCWNVLSGDSHQYDYSCLMYLLRFGPVPLSFRLSRSADGFLQLPGALLLCSTATMVKTCPESSVLLSQQ